MPVRELAPGVHQVPLGGVNAFLIDDGDGLTLVDAGLPGRAERVLAAVQGLGRRPQDVRDVVLTHYHVDHIGGLAALVAATGATVWAHAADAPVVRTGTPPPVPVPGNPVVRVAATLLRPLTPRRADPAPVGRTVADDERLPIAGGLVALHTPGHTPGHLSLLWPRHGGVLVCGDALSHYLRVALAPVNEDRALAGRSLTRLTGLSFGVACFGHGRPLTAGAAAAIRATAARVAPG